MHSFGISENYLIFPHSYHVQFEGGFAKSMAAAFKDLPVDSDECLNNAFFITPLSTQGSAQTPMIRYLPKTYKLYYVHTLNAYENASGIIIDLTTSHGNMFNKPMDTRDGQMNKTYRDSSLKVYVTRFLLPWDNKTSITTQLLSDPRRKTEFQKNQPKLRYKIILHVLGCYLVQR